MATGKFALGLVVVIVIIAILLALVGGILSLVGAISVRNKTTDEKVTKEGVFMLVGGIINGNLLSLSAGIVALARRNKPEKAEGTTEATTTAKVEPVEK